MKRFIPLFFCLLGVQLTGCAIFALRPAQEMSDTAAAMRAAREVQAEQLAPVLYNRAKEYWDTSKRAYKFKEFEKARTFALKAKKLAEEAEFESACCRGGQRGAEDDEGDDDEEG